MRQIKSTRTRWKSISTNNSAFGYYLFTVYPRFLRVIGVWGTDSVNWMLSRMMVYRFYKFENIYIIDQKLRTFMYIFKDTQTKSVLRTRFQTLHIRCIKEVIFFDWPRDKKYPPPLLDLFYLLLIYIFCISMAPLY